MTASGLGFDLAGAFGRPCWGWKCPCSRPGPLVLGWVLTLCAGPWALSGPCGARSWALFGPWGPRTCLQPSAPHTVKKKTSHGPTTCLQPSAPHTVKKNWRGGGSVLTASGLGFDLAGAFGRPCWGWKCPCSRPGPLVLGWVLTLCAGPWALSGPCGARSWALFGLWGPRTCLQPSAPHTVKKKNSHGPTTCLQPSAPHTVKKKTSHGQKKNQPIFPIAAEG